MKARERFLRLVVHLLRHPWQYTKRDLVDRFCPSPTSKCLDVDFQILTQLGLLVHERRRDRHVYAIFPNAEFPELNRLQALSKTDLAELRHELRHLSERRRHYFLDKLELVLDVQKLDVQALRRPNLEKIDLLKAGKRLRQMVWLRRYQSSHSNTIRDRLVEPFHVDVRLDTLQAFQVDAARPEHHGVRHFRLSRIEGVVPSERAWENEADHRWQRTDVFRIVNDDQELLHLSLTTRAKNELLEKFPAARERLQPNGDGATFDLQTEVNAQLYGVLPFVLGNYDQVEIHAPESLRAAVRRAGMAMVKRFG